MDVIMVSDNCEKETEMNDNKRKSPRWALIRDCHLKALFDSLSGVVESDAVFAQSSIVQGCPTSIPELARRFSSGKEMKYRHVGLI
uniref:Uncharacterized protein n=1 Tax=Parascaris equorum TaxID=6256 RepID=A0A914RXP6_PAREQ